MKNEKKFEDGGPGSATWSPSLGKAKGEKSINTEHWIDQGKSNEERNGVKDYASDIEYPRIK